MARLSLSLLGPFQATLDGEPIAGFEATKVRALLAHLTVEAGQPHPRTVLTGLLWPDRHGASTSQARRYSPPSLRFHPGRGHAQENAALSRDGPG